MAEKQALVIGLGQFGSALARHLSILGASVMAVDRNRALVDAVAGQVADAVAFDASDPLALRRAAPASRDVCIVAIGADERASSIIVTALLREMGAKNIVARALDDLSERILLAVGATTVVNPERAFGARLAPQLLSDSIVDELPLGADLVITEFKPPALFIGRSLEQLALPKKELNVIAVRPARMRANTAIMPDVTRPIDGDDILVVVSRPNVVRRYLERL